MYIPTYIAVLIWIFALFGVISLISRVILDFGWSGNGQKGKYSIIIWAKDQEDTIEGLIRQLILKAGLDGWEEALINVVLIDGDSSDNTSQVMESLATEYSFIKFVSCQDLTHSIEKF